MCFLLVLFSRFLIGHTKKSYTFKTRWHLDLNESALWSEVTWKSAKMIKFFMINLPIWPIPTCRALFGSPKCSVKVSKKFAKSLENPISFGSWWRHTALSWEKIFSMARNSKDRERSAHHCSHMMHWGLKQRPNPEFRPFRTFLCLEGHPKIWSIFVVV